MGEHYGWIEIVFTAVVALGFGVWQLWSVNREIAADRARKDAAPDSPSTASGHPVGEHELDDR